MPTLLPRPGRLAGLAALFLLLGGCADEQFEAELASAAFTAPVRLASAPPTVDAGALPDAAAAAEIGEARRVFSLGASDGDERYLFGEIADVAVSASGDTVFVLDRMQRQVKAFSREGAFLYRFGGQGDGPGEYQDPASIALLPWNGQLAIWDVQLQRLTFATPGGETVRTAVPIRQNDYGRVGKKLRAGREGFVMELRADPFLVLPEKQRGFLARLDTLGQVRDTVLDFAIPTIRASGVTDAGDVVSTHQQFPPHWTPDPSWDLAADGGIVLAPGGRYEVFRFSGDGRARDRVARAREPAPLTRRDRLSFVRGAQERVLLNQELPVWAHELIQRRRFARVRPALAGVVATGDGGFAVRRFDPADQWQGKSRTWDEFGADGRPTRTVRYPAGFEPRVVTADLVLGLRRDSLDVDHLEAYRR